MRPRLATWVWLTVAACCIAVSGGDFLSDYLDDKTFGPNPGPCVNRGDCDLNLNPPFTFPTGVGNIEVCLLEFSIVGFGFQAFCQSVEDWVQGGFAQIWDVQCSNLGVRDIRLQSLSATPSREISRITIEDALQVSNKLYYFQKCNRGLWYVGFM